MKTTTLFLLAFAIAGYAGAQKLKDAEVPAAVKTAFAKAFPKANDVKWSKENAKEFEAEFKSDGTEMSANFNTTGTWLGTETEIKKSELPKAVLATISTEFAGYDIKEAEKCEAPGKAIAYEAELEKGKVTYEVQFSADGKVLKKEEKKEGEEDKD